MKDTHQLRALIETWKEENRKSLPLNIDNWRVHVAGPFPKENGENKMDTKPFYKFYSRLIQPDDQ